MKSLKLAFAVSITAVTVLMAPPHAGADEGPGTIVVEQAETVAANQIRYVVRLTFTGDGHPARDATVTATAVSPDGTAQTPVPMPRADTDGRYEATVAFPSPGAWTVRFTSVVPPATLDQPATITGPTTSTTAPPATTTSTTAPASGPAENDDGSRTPILAVGAIVVALGAAAAVVLARRRGR